jgi:hypothetical protein
MQSFKRFRAKFAMGGYSGTVVSNQGFFFTNGERKNRGGERKNRGGENVVKN